MYTKVSILLFAIVLMACGSPENKNEREDQMPPIEKPKSVRMILKAGSNNLFVRVNSDTILVADISDSSKAEIFEKVDRGNGTWALKTSTGKFVSEDRYKNNMLYANRKSADAWETFEIIPVGGTKLNLKSSSGKFVCADIYQGNILVGNRDKAADWETFSIIPK